LHVLQAGVPTDRIWHFTRIWIWFVKFS